MASSLTDIRDGDRAAPAPIWVPAAGAVSASQLTAFIEHCERATGRAIGTSGQLYPLSVEDAEWFWTIFLEWSEMLVEGDRLPVFAGGDVEHARFFPGLRMSYAENLLTCPALGDLDRSAVTSIGADGTRERLTRGELRRLVRGFAAGLRSLGVAPGDRLVSLLRNDAGSVVAALGAAAAGASFSSAAPEMGVDSILSRFGQLDPAVLVVSSIGQPQFEESRLRELAGGLPTLRAIVVMDDCPLPSDLPVPVHRAAGPAADEGTWERYPFNHPLFVLFSSGTTGPAEVHRPRRRRDAARAPQGARAPRRPATRRQAVLPHVHRLDDVELAALGARLRRRDRALRRAGGRPGHAVADRRPRSG